MFKPIILETPIGWRMVVENPTGHMFRVSIGGPGVARLSHGETADEAVDFALKDLRGRPGAAGIVPLLLAVYRRENQ